MSDFIRKMTTFSLLLFTGFCFLKAGAGLVSDDSAVSLTEVEAAVPARVTQQRLQTTPIQQMRPGMRVVGRNPLRIETEATIDPTPEGWRLVSARMRKEDGSYFEAELLRPLSWISRHRAKPGAVIELNMPELHVVGAAEVLSISDCPPIDPGNGPVVLSTFKNIANNVLNIYVEGETEPIGVTAGHPIWSEDRQAFVHSEKLQPGERLRSALGKTVRITSIEIRAGPEPVYNLEVAGEHVYSVTGSGLLVHNTGPCDLVPRSSSISGKGLGGNLVVDRVAGEIQGAVNQADRVLRSGGTGGTRWGAIYQHYQGTGHWLEPISRGNALQQIAETRLINNMYLQEAGVIFNRGHVLGVRNQAGNLLRPDFQVPLSNGRLGVIDISTPGQAPKISKYEVPGNSQLVPQLINVTY